MGERYEEYQNAFICYGFRGASLTGGVFLTTRDGVPYLGPLTYETEWGAWYEELYHWAEREKRAAGGGPLDPNNKKHGVASAMYLKYAKGSSSLGPDVEMSPSDKRKLNKAGYFVLPACNMVEAANAPAWVEALMRVRKLHAARERRLRAKIKQGPPEKAAKTTRRTRKSKGNAGR